MDTTPQTTAPTVPTEPLRPVMMNATELATVTRLLAAAAGTPDQAAQDLLHALESGGRVAGEVDYSYDVVGPWGVDSADAEAEAVAEVRKARAEHWAEGYGRDRRYYEIRARRTPHVSFGDSYWEGDSEDIDVPDTALDAAGEEENGRRLAAGQARHDATTAYLLSVVRGNR